MSCVSYVEYGKLNNVLRECNDKLLGELLTFAEAVISSEKQAEAVKSNIRQIVYKNQKLVKSSIDNITTSENKEDK